MANKIFWRELRSDFESLVGERFSVLWSERKPHSLDGKELASHWTWFMRPSEMKRSIFESYALRGARELGSTDSDAWFEELRERGIGFEQTYPQRDVDKGLNWATGEIRDIVEASIALCAQMEATPRPSKAGRRLRVAKLRELQGNRSNEIFAEDLGISVNTLKSWYRTKPKTPEGETLRLIASRLGVDPQSLLE